MKYVYAFLVITLLVSPVYAQSPEQSSFFINEPVFTYVMTYILSLLNIVSVDNTTVNIAGTLTINNSEVYAHAECFNGIAYCIDVSKDPNDITYVNLTDIMANSVGDNETYIVQTTI